MAIQRISSDQIADGTVIAADIADGSVTGPKLGPGAISSNNISDGSVTVAKGGTGLSTLTANSVVLGNGTDPVQFIAPGTSGNVLTSNGTNWTSQAAAAGGGDYIMQVFTSSGTWTKAAGLKAIKVTVIGGGGGYNSSGGTSSFGSPAFLSATGGSYAPISGATGGSGGSGSGGQLNATGGGGFSTRFLPACAGGVQQGYMGGASAFGFGGAKQTAPPANISTGSAYGGGGAADGYGSGGGGGGAIEYIDAPALPGPQPYTVGAGSPGGALGASGAAGVIVVEEFY